MKRHVGVARISHVSEWPSKLIVKCLAIFEMLRRGYFGFLIY